MKKVSSHLILFDTPDQIICIILSLRYHLSVQNEEIYGVIVVMVFVFVWLTLIWIDKLIQVHGLESLLLLGLLIHSTLFVAGRL